MSFTFMESLILSLCRNVFQVRGCRTWTPKAGVLMGDGVSRKSCYFLLLFTRRNNNNGDRNCAGSRPSHKNSSGARLGWSVCALVAYVASYVHQPLPTHKSRYIHGKKNQNVHVNKAGNC